MPPRARRETMAMNECKKDQSDVAGSVRRSRQDEEDVKTGQGRGLYIMTVTMKILVSLL